MLCFALHGNGVGIWSGPDGIGITERQGASTLLFFILVLVVTAV